VANTVWKGRLTFGLVSFPVRLVRAARKDRIPLRYVREVERSELQDEDIEASSPPSQKQWTQPPEDDSRDGGDASTTTFVTPVRRAYIAEEAERSMKARELQRGYEVAPGQFAVVRSEELRRLRQPTSSAIEIVRSVRMEEIDPVFLETSYYVLPGEGGEHSYSLFYCALKETGYAALAQVAMHGRQHVVVVRPGPKGLIAHTMYYVNEVRGAEEHVAEAKDVAPKELDLARRFVEAIAAPFQPEEFTDGYREQIASLIASKEAVPTRAAHETAGPVTAKVVDIVDALKKSLEKVRAAEKNRRRPVTRAGPIAKTRKRRA